MALPILSNWLSKKIRYSFMATIVFRFMRVGSNVLFDWACWKERVSEIEFKNPSLHVGKPNYASVLIISHSVDKRDFIGAKWINFTQCTQLLCLQLFFDLMIGSNVQFVPIDTSIWLEERYKVSLIQEPIFMCGKPLAFKHINDPNAHSLFRSFG